MATSSIYTDVTIRDKAACARLLQAIEKSQAAKGKEAVLSKRVRVIKGNEIKEFFKKTK